MKKLVFCTVNAMIVVLGFGGCSHVADYYYIDPIMNSNLSKVQLLKNNLLSMKIIEPTCDDTNSTFKDHDTNKTCMYQRNAALTTLILTSDEMCMEHISAIAGNEVISNLSFGTLTTAFAAGSTLATVNTSKSILAGLATFSSAERSLVNDTVYKSMLAPVIIRKISDTRLEKRRALIKQMHDENLTRFSLNFGLIDFMDYHNSCSFLFGLQKALQEGAQDGTKLKKQALEEQLTVLRAQRYIRQNELNNSKQVFLHDSDYNLTNQRIESIQNQLLKLIN